MSKLEDLQPGLRLAGVIPGQNVSVIAVQAHGADAIELTYKDAAGDLGQRVLDRDAEDDLVIAQAEARPLDAPAADFKLVAECQRIKLAGLSDPMLAVTTSDIQPLPHQLRAVYGELLPRTPLRFLLADDPGAGKTIMAGLYIKELIPGCVLVAAVGRDTHRIDAAPKRIWPGWQREGGLPPVALEVPRATECLGFEVERAWAEAEYGSTLAHRLTVVQLTR